MTESQRRKDAVLRAWAVNAHGSDARRLDAPRGLADHPKVNLGRAIFPLPVRRLQHALALAIACTGCGSPAASGAESPAADGSDVAAVTGLSTPPATQPVADPGTPVAICRRALACSSSCYAEVSAPAQSLPECEDPRSGACAAALEALKPPGLSVTLAAVQCVLKCEPQARTLKDLRDLDPSGWADLSVEEQAAWTGIAIGRDCVVGAKCGDVCEGPSYPPTKPVARRGDASPTSTTIDAP